MPVAGRPGSKQTSRYIREPFMKPIKPIKLFYSYSHKDEELRNELENHLSILKRQGVISQWHDRKIEAGNNWAAEIDTNLDQADVILLLVSSDFLASDYCYSNEMKRALERHKKAGAAVIPVILRSVDWQDAPFSNLQALPKDAKPVTLWANRDEAYTNIARGIRLVCQKLRGTALKIAESSFPDTKFFVKMQLRFDAMC